MKKRALGKGLSALIPEFEEAQDGDKLLEIDVNLIVPNKFQPRNLFKEEEIESLAASIKEDGLLQPIVVRKRKDGKYEIISGERRFRAMKKLNYEKVPVILKSVDDDRTMLVMALIENLQRENLNPIEEALGYKRLIDENNLRQEDVAKAVSKSRAYITNTLRLLKLNPEIVDAIKENKITAGHGKALLSIENDLLRKNVFKKILDEGLSVREVEHYSNIKKKVVNKAKKEKPRDRFVEIIEDKLKQKFGTQVILSVGRKGGSINVKFYSNDDLQRILEILDIEVD